MRLLDNKIIDSLRNLSLSQKFGVVALILSFGAFITIPAFSQLYLEQHEGRSSKPAAPRQYSADNHANVLSSVQLPNDPATNPSSTSAPTVTPNVEGSETVTTAKITGVPNITLIAPSSSSPSSNPTSNTTTNSMSTALEAVTIKNSNATKSITPVVPSNTNSQSNISNTPSVPSSTIMPPPPVTLPEASLTINSDTVSESSVPSSTSTTNGYESTPSQITPPTSELQTTPSSPSPNNDYLTTPDTTTPPTAELQTTPSSPSPNNDYLTTPDTTTPPTAELQTTPSSPSPNNDYLTTPDTTVNNSTSNRDLTVPNPAWTNPNTTTSLDAASADNPSSSVMPGDVIVPNVSPPNVNNTTLPDGASPTSANPHTLNNLKVLETGVTTSSVIAERSPDGIAPIAIPETSQDRERLILRLKQLVSQNNNPATSTLSSSERSIAPIAIPETSQDRERLILRLKQLVSQNNNPATSTLSSSQAPELPVINQ